MGPQIVCAKPGFPEKLFIIPPPLINHRHGLSLSLIQKNTQARVDWLREHGLLHHHMATALHENKGQDTNQQVATQP